MYVITPIQLCAGYSLLVQDSQPLDSIPLNECSCSLAMYGEAKKRSCLKINTARRTWYFAADTDEEIIQWLEALFMWGVPESHEEEEVVTSIVEATSALQTIATSVVQSSNSGTIDAFRDQCRVCLFVVLLLLMWILQHLITLHVFVPV